MFLLQAAEAEAARRASNPAPEAVIPEKKKAINFREIQEEELRDRQRRESEETKLDKNGLKPIS